MSEHVALEAEIETTSKVILFIETSIDSLEFPKAERCMVALACFDLIFENQKAVQLLASNELYGSAAILVRPMFESLVRGNWMLFCATDAQVSYFIKNDKIRKNIGEQVKQLEQEPAFSNGWFSLNFENDYRIMHSLTHPGMQQIARRVDGSDIVSNFEEAELIEIIEASNKIALRASLSTAVAADDENLILEIGDFSENYSSKNL